MPETTLKNKTELLFKLNKDMVHGKIGFQEVRRSQTFMEPNQTKKIENGILTTTMTKLQTMEENDKDLSNVRISI